ncbi:ubiquitin C-terminal hydrolase L3 [Lindgomyces ingoldianus]|uniref:Ubiquitin C-terminal hydrolase L3 n=1 Tax=Lindgomyces ingoldianus TaxID=673940 RepID=A0ACB6QHP9_9PLEO|nr:ubiquitin C-terminal hydrolase L3 [Lindgomyces ingoldianus]KAF2466406.1 ubiquitin C-terminal hydrolase L3 [Lindgomyces ingoldianus]
MDPHVLSSGKIWVPLENNPDVMTKLAHKLGLSPNLGFQDVYSLTEPDLLALIPRPCHAVLFLWPSSDISDAEFKREEAAMPAYEGSGPDEPIVWFPQTIGHACGLIGLLHCLTNGEAAMNIVQGSFVDKLMEEAVPLKSKERADLLYNSEELERLHKEAAQTGDSRPPTIEEDVLYGFTAFVKGKDGHLWEMEGWRKGPVDRGLLAEEEDVLSTKALELGPLRIINREKASEGRFSVIALSTNDD